MIMKKKMVTTMALAMALTTVIGSGLTVYACPDRKDCCCDYGVFNDGCARDDGVSASWEVEAQYVIESGGTVNDDGTFSIGFDSFNDSYDSGSVDNDGGDYEDASNSGVSSYDVSDFEGGSENYDSGTPENYDSGSSDNGSSSDAAQSYHAESAGSASTPVPAADTAPAGYSYRGSMLAVPGKESFRQVNKAVNGTFAIYHCGIERYTAQLKDADGNNLAYGSAGLYHDETTDKYYINLVTSDAAASAEDTVGTVKGDVSYLPTLGISGVMIDGRLAVDAEAVIVK